MATVRAEGVLAFTVVDAIPEAHQWRAVDIELPFEAANELLGVQLDRVVMRL